MPSVKTRVYDRVSGPGLVRPTERTYSCLVVCKSYLADKGRPQCHTRSERCSTTSHLFIVSKYGTWAAWCVRLCSMYRTSLNAVHLGYHIALARTLAARQLTDLAAPEWRNDSKSKRICGAPRAFDFSGETPAHPIPRGAERDGDNHWVLPCHLCCRKTNGFRSPGGTVAMLGPSFKEGCWTGYSCWTLTSQKTRCGGRATAPFHFMQG